MPNPKPTLQKLTPSLTEALTRYFATHHAAKLSRNLRCMLLDYLAHELRIGVPVYTDELLWQLQELFDLLDLAAQETNEWHVPKTASKPKQKSRA
jgi:hypothetical protein